MALMSAVVQSNGTLVRGAGVVSSLQSGTGWYTVRFSRVLTYNASGVPTDLPFKLIVFCAQ